MLCQCPSKVKVVWADWTKWVLLHGHGCCDCICAPTWIFYFESLQRSCLICFPCFFLFYYSIFFFCCHFLESIYLPIAFYLPIILSIYLCVFLKPYFHPFCFRFVNLSAFQSFLFTCVLILSSYLSMFVCVCVSFVCYTYCFIFSLIVVAFPGFARGASLLSLARARRGFLFIPRNGARTQPLSFLQGTPISRSISSFLPICLVLPPLQIYWFVVCLSIFLFLLPTSFLSSYPYFFHPWDCVISSAFPYY